MAQAPRSSSEESTPFSDAPTSHFRLPIPLTGWLERQGFSPVLTAVLALIVTFILFQGIGTLAGALLLILRGGVPADVSQGELLAYLISEHPDIILLGNSIGQVFGLALPALLFARLHTPRAWRYLRVQKPDGWLFGASLLGWVALLPVVQWLGHLNQMLPLPEAIRAFDQMQMELISKVLVSDLGLAASLLALAVVPALCEELMFRGYVQRNFERATGIIGGIVITGVIFGVYHLRLTQVLPLTLLGIYLGYVLWCTGSLWSAAAVHFANNAFAVFVGTYLESHPELQMRSMEDIQVPWFTILLGSVAAAYIVYWMYRRRQRML